MGGKRWFYRDEEDLRAFREKLKLTQCPHCKVVGALILHGFLRGYDESSPRQRTVRAQRVFCSNRGKRPGCGRTFSVWLVDKIRRLGLTAGGLFKYLNLVVAQGMAAASRAFDCHLSDRTLQRIWNRFKQAQSDVRTALFSRCKPPEPAAGSSQSPEAQVLAHLRAVFPESAGPVAEFQMTTGTFFL